jgi:WD40 repeat protein
VGTGQERATLKGHPAQVNSVALSGDGKTLASGSEDKTIKVWDVPPFDENAGHAATEPKK